MLSITREERAISTIVAAMLLLVVITTFMAAINAYYIPSLGARSEIEHMQQVRQSFNELDSRISLYSYLAYQASLDDNILPPPDMKIPISLGSKGIQYFSITPSSGALVANPNEMNLTNQTPGTKMNVTINYRETINGTEIINVTAPPINSTGSLTYRGFNHFWISQDFILEHGALILSQPQYHRSMIISAPLGDPCELKGRDNVTLNLNMYNVTNRKSVSGNADYMLLLNVKHAENHSYTDVNNVTINVTSGYHQAWYDYFESFMNLTRMDEPEHDADNQSVGVTFYNYTSVNIILSDVAVSYSI